MTREQQKAAERRTAERFLAVLEPDRVWDIAADERPDFVLRVDHGSIGLEVSDLYWESAKGSPRQALEALRARVCDQATRLWDEAERPHVEVWMIFEPQGELRKSEVESVAQRVTELVETNLPPDGSSRRVEHGNDPPAHWPRQIHSITVSRLVRYERTFWHSNDSGWIPALTPEGIQAVISSKSGKAEGYSKCLDELWLVLSMDRGRLSSTFELSDETRSMTYQSRFQRVFLFEEVAKSIVELAIEGAG